MGGNSGGGGGGETGVGKQRHGEQWVKLKSAWEKAKTSSAPMELFSLPGPLRYILRMRVPAYTRDSQQFSCCVAAVPRKHVSFVFRHAFSTANLN